MKQRDLIQKLKQGGYHLDRTRGGHLIFEKPGAKPVQVPNHREVNEGTAQSILKAAGLK